MADEPGLEEPELGRDNENQRSEPQPGENDEENKSHDSFYSCDSEIKEAVSAMYAAGCSDNYQSSMFAASFVDVSNMIALDDVGAILQQNPEEN